MCNSQCCAVTSVRSAEPVCMRLHITNRMNLRQGTSQAQLKSRPRTGWQSCAGCERVKIPFCVQSRIIYWALYKATLFLNYCGHAQVQSVFEPYLFCKMLFISAQANADFTLLR
jgi:hypothetical protein